MRAKKPAENPYAGDPVETDELLSRIGGGVEASMPLEIGRSLQIEQSGRWWSGQILELGEDGTVKVHYDGWESSWDEWVTRDRLRLQSPGPRAIVVTLENGARQSGVLRGQTADFLILERESGELFIAKTKILFFETT